MAEQILRPILPFIQANPAAAPRFWSKVAKRAPDQCWDWQGGKSRGYGRFKIASFETRHANRVAWTLANGAEPGDMMIRHSCDRPMCCNPAHLSLGTAQDNVDDKVARGRCRTGRQDGENNGAAILTNDQVVRIVKMFRDGLSNTYIATRFRVSHSLISRIRTGRSWQKQAAAAGWTPNPLTEGAAA
jgi:hypothetical protein